MSDSWDQLKTIVADALELPEERRDAFLRESCADNASLLAEARELVGCYQASDGVLDKRTDAWLGIGGPDLLALGGRSFGRYRLERLIAEGAMAAVYQARQVSPHRVVALKLVRTVLPLVNASHRFEQEARALGRLQHPNIAAIYEAGVHTEPGGVILPYLAMEYVDGPPITEWARTKNLSRRHRIELLIKVAQAVHAAHQQAVIHRDLKPANVLVDPSGEPKVLDFGIARILGAEDQAFTWQTTAGVLLGTPGYMSPEQAAGRSELVDVRSDVWALGVLLHELLTDRLPVDVRGTTIAQALKKIETQEPPPISRYDKSLAGDIETIVATALAMEKERRYPSALALADDLRRLLEYQPITARPQSRAYRLKKFIRRHRVGVAMTTLLAMALIGGTVATTLGLLEARRQRDAAVAAQTRATAVSSYLQQMLSSADTSTGGSRGITVLQAIENGRKSIGATFAGDPLAEAGVREAIGWTLYSLGEYDPAETELRKAMELYRNHLGESHRSTLDVSNYLVTNLRWQYKAADAQVVMDRILPLTLKTFGATDPTSLAILDNQAGLAADRGDNRLAERLYKELIETCRRSPSQGPAGPFTLTAMNNLAVVYLETSRFADAEALLRELIEIRARREGMKSIGQLTSRSNLAICLNHQGRYAEARDLLRDSLADADEVLGPSHSHAISALSGMATALAGLGDLEGAVATRREVLRRLTEHYGPDNPQTLRAAGNLAAELIESEKYAEAEPYLRKSVELFERAMGPAHPETFRSRNVLASCLVGLGQLREAERIWRTTLARIEEATLSDSSEYAINTSGLARCLIDQGRPDEAIELLRSTMSRLSPQSIARAKWSFHRQLGRALLLKQDTAAAGRELQQAWELTPDEPVLRRRVAGDLLTWARATGDAAEIERWEREIKPPVAPSSAPSR